MPDDPRADELSSNLAAFEKRLDDACRAAGRDRDGVTLIAVTKTFPVDDVRRLAALGLRHFGENRDQEAGPKADSVRDLGVHWHFVGQLQVNKCRSVASYADAVHSVDRDRLVAALTKAAVAVDRTIDAFVQVALDADPTRGGAAISDIPALADRIDAAPNLRLAGVMAVAPLGTDATAAFDRLAEVASDLRRSHPDAQAISAGMSGDLEAAIAAGATHVRIGTALLGGRAPLVR
jgi:pyridoxal phosphate enzyme (YggS family)